MKRVLVILLVLVSTSASAEPLLTGPMLTRAFTAALQTDSTTTLNLFLVNLGAGKFYLPNTTADPSTALEGTMRYDGTNHVFRFYNGTAWGVIGPGQALETTSTPRFARLGLGVAAGSTALLTVTGGGIVAPSADSTTAICFDKADAATAVWCLDTTNTIAVGSGAVKAAQFFTTNGTALGTDKVNIGANGVYAITGDTAFARSTAGLGEIDNGTIGTYRDLITRSLATGAATYGSAPIGTVGSGTGITVNATGDVRTVTNKVTLTQAAFSAAATTADATIYTLAAKQKLVDIYADVTQVFSGGAVSAATMTCGITAGGNTLLVSFDIKTATITRGLADADLGTAITRAAAIQGGYMPSWSATTAISCRVTTTSANTNALTQGSITFYLTTRAF